MAPVMMIPVTDLDLSLWFSLSNTAMKSYYGEIVFENKII